MISAIAKRSNFDNDYERRQQRVEKIILTSRVVPSPHRGDFFIRNSVHSVMATTLSRAQKMHSPLGSEKAYRRGSTERDAPISKAILGRLLFFLALALYVLSVSTLVALNVFEPAKLVTNSI